MVDFAVMWEILINDVPTTLPLGSSINDVTPKGEGGGVQKMADWGDFQGINGVTRGGRGV